MNFDNRGYLQPEGLIETTMEMFIATFVGENPKRRSMFQKDSFKSTFPKYEKINNARYPNR
jgi:hypothetical protein